MFRFLFSTKQSKDGTGSTKLILLLSLLTLLILHRLQSEIQTATFVPGLGFSGFWYALGFIHSSPANLGKEYYCFSAGCLAVSSMLMGISVDGVSEVALDLQGGWRRGEIERFRVMEMFVERIVTVYPEEDTCVSDDCSVDLNKPQWLSQINVVTSKYFFLPIVTKPTSTTHLKQLLVRSAWIPYATGLGFFTPELHVPSIISNTYAHNVLSKLNPFHSTTRENDGGFSLLLHPRCTEYVLLPFTWIMVSNFLNVNLEIEVVMKMYYEGIEDGKAKALGGVVAINE